MNFQSNRRMWAGEATAQDVRVLTSRYGGKQGPEFDVAVGDRCFRVGELTKTLLEKGTPVEDLDMLEIDPDAEESD
jgi:hypothetical protein